MSSFSKVSLILFVDQGHASPKVWRTIHALATTRWDSQVLLVDNADGQAETEQPTPDRSHPRLANLAEAISAAKHPVIAIVEEDFEVNPRQWQIAAERIEHAPVQTVFYSPIASRRFKRVLIWLYALMLRFLFRIRRNELQRGMTLLRSSVLKNELPPTTRRNVCEPGSFQVTRMLAMLRLKRVPILETDIVDPLDLTSTQNPASRTVRHASSRAIRFWLNEVMFPCSENQVQHKRTGPLVKFGLTVLLVMAAIFVLFRSLNYPLIEPDEGRNAQLALNLFQSGQWMTLSLSDENYWDKPPLQIWAIAASYKLLGVSQSATRFPVALAALLTVLSTLLIGKRLVGFQSAWLGAGLLLLTSGFVFTGRFVTMDASLTAMVTLVLLLGFIAIRDGFKKRLAVFAGIACGFGLLFKGPVIAVLCVPPLLFSAWLSQTGRSNRKHRLIWFGLPALLIAAPWFVATAVIHPEFLSYYLWKHHVVRFSSAFNHREPFWYYFIGIFLFMFPASYLLPSVTRFMTSRDPQDRLLRTREQGFLLFSALWIILFFTLSESKLPTYIVPAFPPICLLMGVLLERRVVSKFALARDLSIDTPSGQPSVARQHKHKRTFLEGLTRRAPFELVVWMVVFGIAVYVLDKTQFASLYGIGTMIVILSLLTVMAIRKRSSQRLVWFSFGLSALFVVLLGAHHLMPAISKVRSIHLAAEKIGATAEFKDAPIVFFGRESHGIDLTLDSEKVIHFEESQNNSLVNFLEQNPTAIIVSSNERMEMLRNVLPWTIELEPCEMGRHLYLSRPNQKIIARERNENLHR